MNPTRTSYTAGPYPELLLLYTLTTPFHTKHSNLKVKVDRSQQQAQDSYTMHELATLHTYMHMLRTERLLNISEFLTGIEGVCVNCKRTTLYKALGSAACRYKRTRGGEIELK
jgi:hypothetical protein